MTTLYFSDCDTLQLFVDHVIPIEAGLLPDGSRDLQFLEFKGWNSEIRANTFGIAGPVHFDGLAGSV